MEVVAIGFASLIATSALRTVVKKLTDNGMEEVAQIWNAKKEINELVAAYEKIGAVLEKCGEIDPQTKNGSRLGAWLRDLEGFCYDTDDLLLSGPPSQGIILPSLTTKRLTVPRRIVNLRNKLQATCRWIEDFLGAKQGGHNSVRTTRRESRTASALGLLSNKRPLVDGTSREEDKQEVVRELTSSDQADSAGVSIIGVHGLGKTALARTVLADDKITGHFQLILRADVSGEFCLDDVVCKLLSSHPKGRDLEDPARRVEELGLGDRPQHPEFAPGLEVDRRARNLRGLLGKHKTLIVLDDLWSVTNEDWEDFTYVVKSSLGWKVLVTTRNPNVAEVTESIPHYLDQMTEKDCNRLIVEKSKLSELELGIWADDIAAIAKKCKGLPIIANKVGLVLSKKKSAKEKMKKTIMDFKKIKNLWELTELAEIHPYLTLNMPHQLSPDHLRRCFAYCLLFSPGHKFIKDDLVQLWKAEGFVSDESQLSGSQCFDDLLSRSLLQPLPSINEEEPAYKLLEYNRDFAELLASDAFLRIDGDEGTPIFPSPRKSIRHLSLSRRHVDTALLKQIKDCERLRTFLLLHQRVPNIRAIVQPKNIRAIAYSSFPTFKRLRLLDLSHTNICTLGKSLDPLKHLRYLDLSWSDIRKLPETICSSFRALQVLKLDECSELVKLPNDLHKLISLRHLHVNMKLLDALPSNLGKLTNLESLSSYAVGKTKGYKVAELRNMEHLRELCISRLEKIGSSDEAQESKLRSKPMLKKLVLEWDSSATEMTDAIDVLQGLEPGNDLNDLVVRNYMGHRFPGWLVSPSRKLVSMYLENCHGCKVLPDLWQLPLLKTLVLHSFDTLETINRRISSQNEPGFRSLESLQIHGMRKLVRCLVFQAGDTPCLRTLKIIDCPRLVHFPRKEAGVCVEISGCPVLEPVL